MIEIIKTFNTSPYVKPDLKIRLYLIEDIKEVLYSLDLEENIFEDIILKLLELESTNKI